MAKQKNNMENIKVNNDKNLYYLYKIGSYTFLEPDKRAIVKLIDGLDHTIVNDDVIEEIVKQCNKAISEIYERWNSQRCENKKLRPPYIRANEMKDNEVIFLENDYFEVFARFEKIRGVVEVDKQ